MLCLLILTLIALCYAANNNSSDKTSGNKGTQQFPPYSPCGYGACFCAPGMPGMPGNPGPSGPAGIAGSPGTQGSTGPRGDKGDAGKPGSQGIPGPKGLQGTTGKVGPRGTKGEIGNPGSRGPPGTLTSNWKQCVWNNINDDKDTGLVKECVFKKKSDITGLRVFWNGNLRIQKCNNCCRRWYFTFNGAECSAPAAIDGVVYMVYGNKGGAQKNLHRPRQLEGVCEKVHKGTVRVGFWVGNCAGYGSADAYSGWNSVSRIYVEEVPPPQA